MSQGFGYSDLKNEIEITADQIDVEDMTISNNLTVEGLINGEDINDMEDRISVNETDIAALAGVDGTLSGSIAANTLANVLTQADLDGFPDELKNLTQVEIQQIEAINSVSISNNNWGHLSSTDQDLATTDDVIFNTVDGVDVSALATTVASNTGAIANNVSDIADNLALINTNISDIGDLDTRVTTAEGDISTNDGRLTVLEGDMSTAQTDINNLEALIDQDVTTTGTPSFSALTVNGNITVTGNVDGVDVSDLSSTVSTNTTNISTNVSNITTAQNDIDGFDDNLKNLTSDEISQLLTINSTTISATQWGYLGALDQSLTTTSDPQFSDIEFDSSENNTQWATDGSSIIYNGYDVGDRYHGKYCCCFMYPNIMIGCGNRSEAFNVGHLREKYGSILVPNWGTTSTTTNAWTGMSFHCTGTSARIVSLGTETIGASESFSTTVTPANATQIDLYENGNLQLRCDTNGISVQNSLLVDDIDELTGSAGITFGSEIYLPTSGGTASALNYYEEYTSSGNTWNSNIYPTNPSGEYTITQTGRCVHLSIPSTTASSVSGTADYIISSNAIPTRFRPSATVYATLLVSVNTVETLGAVSVGTSGNITIYFTVNQGNFPAGSTFEGFLKPSALIWDL